MKKLMVIAALLVFTTGSAWAAAEWNFYGSARVSTFYTKWDQNVMNTTVSNGTVPGGLNPFLGTGGDTDAYEQDLNGNARIGANVKVSDTLTGEFEYGTKKGNANIRILWGEWNFGAGSLGIGQNYTPLLFPYSNQVYNIYAMKDGDTNMSRFGMLYGKREAMIRLKFGNFQIAAVKPRTTVWHDYVAVGTGYVNISPALAIPLSQPGTQVEFPNIQAKYRMDFDWGHLNFAAGYQNFDVVAGTQKYDVTSYVLGLGARLNVGKAYFKGSLWGGQNVGNLADTFVNGQIYSTAGGASGDVPDGAGLGFARYRNGSVAGTTAGVTDNEALAGLLVAGYEIRKGLYLEAGYGYTTTELDETGSVKDDCEVWYLQSTIFLAPGVFVTPEVGGLDAKDDNQPDILYFGFKWQINF
jgi:hypothetical protein